MLVRKTNLLAAVLVGGIAQLDPTEDDRHRTREALLKLLGGYTGGNTVLSGRGIDLLALEDTSPTAALRAHLASEEANDRVADALVARVVQLAISEAEKKHACESLLGLLEHQNQSLVATALADGIMQLNPIAQIESYTREMLLGLLSGQAESYEAGALIRAVLRLATTAQAKSHVRDALVALLATHSDGRTAAELANAVTQLDPTAQDKRQALDVLLPSLATST